MTSSQTNYIYSHSFIENNLNKPAAIDLPVSADQWIMNELSYNIPNYPKTSTEPIANQLMGESEPGGLACLATDDDDDLC